MEILNQQQIERVSLAVEGLNNFQLAWLSGYVSGLSSQKTRISSYSATITPFETPTIPKITLLYGSQTGNSKRVAEELNSALLAQGISVSLSNILDYRTSQLKKEQKLIIVISTQGNAEPPDDALGFFKFIESDRVERLEHLEYAILGLGDSSYDEFCYTSVYLDKKLEELGASRFLDRLDADIDFEEVAAIWQKDILTYFKENQTDQQNGFSLQEPLSSTSKIKWTEENPYQAEILSLIDLTATDSEQEAYHLEIAIDDYGSSYKPGDILAFRPQNTDELVNEIIKFCALDASETVQFKKKSVTLYDALLSKLEITKITKKVIKNYAESTHSNVLLNFFANKSELADFIQKADLLDLLKSYPEKITAQKLVDSLRPLISRQYSIASSVKTHADEVHILVKPVVYNHKGRQHLGVASNWLKKQKVGDTIPVHIKENSGFKLPKNPDDKIIMIGAGTGVAPFRSFLFEREANGSRGNCWLFFGEQRFQSDFLYQTDWQKFLNGGVLERMTVAFSRDQEKKIYVQHKILEEAEKLYQWILDGAYLYVCGDINHLAADVHQALIKVISEQSGKSVEEAESYLQELQLQKRYQRDVY
ncbi:MAG: assimilatory sulfite reductase (NADPH) flavoprotein subunit [Cocleimonas sp.]|nr:assimilatory sulfite reductase (NADPH) flavoprotein subunit [Cocleimonas sp.]